MLLRYAAKAMGFTGWVLVSTIFVLGTAAAADAASTPLSMKDYRTYYADIDTEERGLDGIPDLLLRADDGRTFVGSKVIIPSPLPPRADLPTLVFCGTPTGAFELCTAKENAKLPIRPVRAFVDKPFKQFVEDWDGDGLMDLLIQSQDSKRNSLLFRQTKKGTVELRDQFTHWGGFLISGNPNIEVERGGPNGRSDLLLDQAIHVSFSQPNTTEDEGILEGTLVGTAADRSDVVQGQLRYSIPIALPSGPGGVDPSFSLNYTSDAGYGPLGSGFRMSFQSYIERCPRTRLRDGKALPLTGGADPLCLDGVRLVLASGKHWHNGAVYYPEQESGLKVVYERASSAAYDQGVFKVYTPNGEVRAYGESAETRIAGGAPVKGATGRWALSQVSNRQGYGYTLEYLAQHGAALPLWLHYTHNGKPLGQSVQFKYDKDTYAPTLYVVGRAYGAGRRLTEITLTLNDKTAKAWRFAYEINPTTQRALLHQFQQCGSDQECVTPTTLTWEKVAQSHSQKGVHTTLVAGTDSWHWWLDINRDGVEDLCRVYDHDFKSHFECRLSNGQGGFGKTLTVRAPIARGGWNRDPHWVDLNQNGYPDFCYSKINGRTDQAYCYANQMGDNFAAQWQSDLKRPPFAISQRQWVDVTGDGVPEHCYGYHKADAQGRARPRITCQTGVLANNTLTYSTGDTATFAADRGSAFQGMWIDLNGDTAPDFCTFDARDKASGRLQCHQNGAGRINPNLSPWDSKTTWLTDPKATVGPTGRSWGGDPSAFASNFFDMNGDGFTDYCRIHREGDENSRKYRARCLINTGTGWDKDWVSPLMTLGGAAQALSFADVNQDGYADWCAYTPGTVQCQLSRGGRFSVHTQSIQLKNAPATVSGLSWADVTGDGIPNVCLMAKDGVTCYPESAVGQQDRLIEIRNGLGVTTAVTYTGLDDTRVYSHQNGDGPAGLRYLSTGLRVVSQLIQDDGVGGQLVTNYVYKNYGYRPDERGAVGFGYILSKMHSRADPDVIQQETWYEPYTGRMSKRVTIFGDAYVLTETTDWESVFYQPGSGDGYRVAPDADSVFNEESLALRYVMRPTSTRQVLASKGASTVVQYEEVYQYDHYGNRISEVQTTQGASGDVHTRSTESTYENDVTRWLMGRRTRSEVTSVSPGSPPLTRITTWEYFKTGSGAGQIKTLITDPDQASRRHTTTYAYNAFGLVQSVTETPAGDTARTQSYRYDADGRFLIEAKNPLGHISKYAYDPVSGQRTRETDPNGRTTVWEYDPLGRLTREIGADGTRVDLTYAACRIDCPEHAAYVVTRQPSDINGKALAAATSTYRDALGREVEERWGGFGGETLVQRTTYDALGRLTFRSVPHKKGEQAKGYGVTRRDALGRPTLEGLPSGLRVSTEYSGLTTRQTLSGDDVTPQTRTSVKNGLGRVMSMTDAEGGFTSYRYDAEGRLTRTRLPNGTVVTQTYDRGGRKIRSEDPNTGTWRYAYNGADQLVLQENGNGARICHAYDVLGRPIKRVDDYLADRDWASAAASAQKACAGQSATTTWAYDTAKHGIGQLASVSQGSAYRETLTYDSVGRPATTTVKADGVTYTRQSQYDGVTGRLAKTTPLHRKEGAKVTVAYRYNDHGYLTALAPANEPNYAYWTIKNQNARGQVTERQMAGGLLRAVSEYRPGDGRRLGQRILRTVDSGGVYCEQSEYDAKGRLQKTWKAPGCEPSADQLEAVALGLPNATPEERLRAARRLASSKDRLKSVYDYDLLDRLTLETVSHGRAQQGSTQTQYDAEGNITERAGVGAYHYDESCSVGAKRYTPGPHAVTRIVGAASGSPGDTANYCYDEAGNMIAGAGKRITYSSFNKPLTITEGASTVRFQYGPDRERLKTVTQVGTSAKSKTITQRRLGAYEHVLIKSGGKTVEQERFHLPGGVVLSVNKGETSPDEQYLITNDLGSVVAVADKLGAVAVRHQYDPWGRPRDAQGKALDKTQWRDLERLEKGTEAGFTGHGMLDEVGLIHMGGRLYDPTAGRFLSADPFIEDLTNAQTYNRYSYVGNSPTNRTDPSGYTSCNTSATYSAPGCVEERLIKEHVLPPITVHANPPAPPPPRVTTLPTVIVSPGPGFGALWDMGSPFSGIGGGMPPMGGGGPAPGPSASPSMTSGCGAGCGEDSSWGHALYTGLLPNIANVTDNAGNLPAQTGRGSLHGAAVAIGNVFVDLGNAAASGLLTTMMGWSMARDVGSIIHVDSFEIPQDGAYAAASVEGVGMVFAVTKVAKAGSMARAAEVGEKGGLNLFKWGKESTLKADGWRDGDFMLYLPDRGGPKANWKQNAGYLREQMNKREPIYDSYRDPKTGQQIGTGGFLNAERKLLESRGWQYNSSTGAYHPPG